MAHSIQTGEVATRFCFSAKQGLLEGLFQKLDWGVVALDPLWIAAWEESAKNPARKAQDLRSKGLTLDIHELIPGHPQ